MFFQRKDKPLKSESPFDSSRTARLQTAQLTLARLLKAESLGQNVIIERTIAEIEVSRFQIRFSNAHFLGGVHPLKMLVIT
jgi:hypothetical protein